MFSEFMFIRPWWLLALIPSFILWLLFYRRIRQTSDWQTIIEPKFQPWLLGTQQQTKKTLPISLIGLLIIWLIGVIALAGPSWQTQTAPAQPNASGSIIILDLSASMYADDLNPNRITRAQFKLTDFILQNPELQLGLLAYAGTPHIITPLSQDATTLLNLLPHLTPSIMPRPGADAVAAFELASEMLNQIQLSHRHIIWLTDDIESDEINPIVQLITRQNIQLSIMSVGTQQGGVIHHPRLGLLKDNQDQLIIAPIPETRLAQVAQQTGGRYVRLRLDDQDLSSLLPQSLPSGRSTAAQSTQQVQHPVDFGVYFIILLLLLAMFAIRRGWLMNFASVALITSLLSANSLQPVWAENPTNEQPSPTWLQRLAPLFMTGDQRGYQAWLKQDYLAAEREFNDPSWHAASLYRIGGYQRAAELYAQDLSAQGQYNLGNSLALAGQLEEAITAYDRALKLKPDFSQAQENRNLVQQLLDQQPEAQDQANIPIPSQNDNEGEDDGGGGQASSDDNQNNQDESQADENANQEGDSNNESANGQNDETDTRGDSTGRPEAAEELDPGLIRDEEQATDDTDEDTTADDDIIEDEGAVPGNQIFDPQLRELRERDQSNQAWLNQIQDNPGRFLQRKFQYQIQQESQTSRSRSQDQGGKTW
jgi:Ca-activated chloride channel family protein